ncbi:hypothetical protein EX30DRAFT_337787 [Ascodesmis nigricans]|uniref:Clathrin/coatomer adaptor adaptin-like N-terminal domain-containing protein n=1 Tax=Ascodesmis nigricans TaxID=341454 RepID=A0A4V3SJV3_9PEZI|nr:hypothetical protein EX30DRAFT_337787 [Ascodesmis nigricans]
MDSLSRISSVLETARDLTLEAAQSASAAGRLGRKDKPISARETRKLLNSRMDREVLDGLRRVITMMSRGTDCSEFFADVVKNVASPILEIKKLVYIYLLRYAESEPDLALLSINTIQKALNDQNQLVRAMAIRVMSGIRVPVISQIVALAIKKGVTDMSAYVRKCAALAIPKCYRLDPTTMPQLTEYLGTLLGDKNFYVVGAAVMAFLEICPEKWELIHPHYRSLVKTLIDMDEWGQLATLRLLTSYARRSFPLREQKPKTENKKQESDGFYDEDNSVDPDLDLLLKACPPLLQSRNSAVLVAVVRVYVHLAPPEYITKAVGALCGLLRAPVNIQYIALVNIISVMLKYPQPFAPYATHFLVTYGDPPHIWSLKLESLTLLFPLVNTHTKNLILFELEYFAQGYDKDLVKEAVRAIGRCAQTETKNAARCLRVLLRQVESAPSDGTLVAESLTVIRHIIQQNPDAHHRTVVRLANALNKTTNPSARASIIWLVGEFAGINKGNNVAADTLRLLSIDFANEAEETKQQIVLLAAKVYAHHLNRTQSGMPTSGEQSEEEMELQGDSEKHPIEMLFSYIMLLARYDTSYDLRDRARMYKSLLSVPSSTQLATLLLLAPKPTPQAPSPSSGREDFIIGSASMVLGKEESVRNYEPLPDWVTPSRAPSPSLREPPKTETEVGKGGAMGSIMVGGRGHARGGSGSGTPGWMSGAGSPRFSGFGGGSGAGTPPTNSGGKFMHQAKKNEPVESLEDFLASDDEEEEEEEEESEEESEEEDEDEDEETEEEDEEESEEESEEEEEDSQLLGASSTSGNGRSPTGK